VAADYKRIHRLLRIYELIQGDQGWTAMRLAAEFRATERTIFRDLGVLKNVGIPIHHDPEKKCYQIRRDHFMQPIELTFDEALALVSLGQHVHRDEQIPFSGPALRALAKVRGQLPRPIQRELELVEGHMEVKLAASATQEGFHELYERVRQAISLRRCLRCLYESPGKGGGVHFQLKPYTLFFCQRAWYVVGFHGGRGEVRTLKLNRFADMELLDVPFVMPRDFSLQKHLGCAWRMMRGSKRHEVELEFDASFAETIADTAWHATQSFEFLDGGALRFMCTVDGLEEILWWVLSMGSHCRVVGPPELADRVQQEATRMVSLYAAVATPGTR
jgi:predicted DNA-binding transcriptional regulator YafY